MSRIQSLLPCIVFAVAVHTGCDNADQDSLTLEITERYQNLVDHQLMRMPQARSLPGFVDVVEPPIEWLELHRQWETGELHLGISQVFQPVVLNDGAIWTPPGFLYPEGCQALYQGLPLTGPEVSQEHLRFERCLVDPHLLDFETPEHVALVYRYFEMQPPDEVPPGEGSADEPSLGFDGAEAWHCSNQDWCEQCGNWVRVNDADDPEGSIEEFVPDPARPEETGYKTCHKKSYHPVLCWTSSNGVYCDCVNHVECTPCTESW